MCLPRLRCFMHQALKTTRTPSRDSAWLGTLVLRFIQCPRVPPKRETCKPFRINGLGTFFVKTLDGDCRLVPDPRP